MDTLIILFFIFFPIITLIVSILYRNHKKKQLNKLTNLFFSPLLGFKYEDNRLSDTDFISLIEELDKYNILLTSLFYDYSNRNDEAKNQYSAAEMLFPKKDSTVNINPINSLNPFYLVSRTSYNLGAISNDFRENLKNAQFKHKIVDDSQRYLYLKEMLTYLKEYKFLYFKVQFMLREVFESAKLNNSKEEFINNLKKINNPLTNFLIKVFEENGFNEVKNVIKSINTMMYEISNLSTTHNKYSLPILMKYILPLRDLYHIVLFSEASLINKIFINEMNDKYLLLSNTRKRIFKKALKENKKIIDIFYLNLFLNKEIFYVEDDLMYKFLLLKLEKSLVDIYSNVSTVESFKKNLLKNIKCLQLKEEYKTQVLEFIKNTQDGKHLILNIERLNLDFNKILKNLLENNYSEFNKIPTLNRKEIIADYLQILQKFEKIQEANIFKFVHIDSNGNIYNIIKEFVEDKIFNALRKETLIKKGLYLETIKLELLTSESEFISREYGKELEEIIKFNSYI